MDYWQTHPCSNLFLQRLVIGELAANVAWGNMSTWEQGWKLETLVTPKPLFQTVYKRQSSVPLPFLFNSFNFWWTFSNIEKAPILYCPEAFLWLCTCKKKIEQAFSFSSRFASPPAPHTWHLLFCESGSTPTTLFSVFQLSVLMCHHLWLLFLSLAPSTTGQTAKFFATLVAQGVYQIVFRLQGWPHKEFIFPSGSQFCESDTDGWIFYVKLWTRS